MVQDAHGDAAQPACVRRRTLERRPASLDLDDGRPLWLVTVTLRGEPLSEEQIRRGLKQLNDSRAFLLSTRYDEHQAQVRYWDEGATAVEPTRQALALWTDADVNQALPGWSLCGLGVADRVSARRQWQHGQHPPVFALGEILPFDEQAQLA
jgi:hypothetical protein